jgi:UDP-N-acetylmuramate dehydrogenase
MGLMNLLFGIEGFMEIIEKDLTKKANIRTKSFAKYYFELESINEIKYIISFANQRNLQIQILGDGTNILFSKEEYTDKLFIKLKKTFDFIEINNNFVEIGASFSLMKAGKLLAENGYDDFVYMSLIPGSIGGAIRQNAGTTKEGEIKDSFISCTVYDLKENIEKIFTKEEMKFSYRNSLIQEERNRYLVLSGKFELRSKTKNIEELKSFIKEKKQNKSKKEPKGYSFGSTFKSHLQENPAWWYIDQVGLKNFAIDGAKFSEVHANWIINFNNANAKNIIELINLAKKKVKEKFNINLVQEVEII